MLSWRREGDEGDKSRHVLPLSGHRDVLRLHSVVSACAEKGVEYSE